MIGSTEINTSNTKSYTSIIGQSIPMVIVILAKALVAPVLYLVRLEFLVA